MLNYASHQKATFVLKCMVLKKPKAKSKSWNIKISSINLKKRCIIQKGSIVMIYAEAKWKASKFYNHSLVVGHICSFL